MLWIICDRQKQTSWLSHNVLYIADNLSILPGINLNLSLLSNNHHRTKLLHILGLWDTPATCSYMLHDSCSVWWTCWQLMISFWPQANYAILRTSHFLSLSSSSPIPQRQIMDIPPHQAGSSRTKFTRLAGASSNMSLIGTQQQWRQLLVHHDAANAATRHMTQDAHLEIVGKSGSTTNMK